MRQTYLAGLALCLAVQFAAHAESLPKVAIPQEIQTIPAGYFDPSPRPGTLEELTYQTYESFSYRQRSRKLQKRAIIYLPYGCERYANPILKRLTIYPTVESCASVVQKPGRSGVS
ncbi:MAG: hypothetical protein C0504_07105 [Candidatus Solibacter sp.]|nr:hypothetical protein [Candidatus Solibacter sp.]